MRNASVLLAAVALVCLTVLAALGKVDGAAVVGFAGVALGVPLTLPHDPTPPARSEPAPASQPPSAPAPIDGLTTQPEPHF